MYTELVYVFRVFHNIYICSLQLTAVIPYSGHLKKEFNFTKTAYKTHVALQSVLLLYACIYMYNDHQVQFLYTYGTGNGRVNSV